MNSSSFWTLLVVVDVVGGDVVVAVVDVASDVVDSVGEEVDWVVLGGVVVVGEVVVGVLSGVVTVVVDDEGVVVVSVVDSVLVEVDVDGTVVEDAVIYNEECIT